MNRMPAATTTEQNDVLVVVINYSVVALSLKPDLCSNLFVSNDEKTRFDYEGHFNFELKLSKEESLSLSLY